MAYVTLEKVTADDIESSAILQKLDRLKREAGNSDGDIRKPSLLVSVKHLAKKAREKSWVN